MSIKDKLNNIFSLIYIYFNIQIMIYFYNEIIKTWPRQVLLRSAQNYKKGRPLKNSNFYRHIYCLDKKNFNF